MCVIQCMILDKDLWEEIKEAVEKINGELSVLHDDLVFDDSYPSLITSETDFEVMIITFLGENIWFSDEDERNSGADGEYEPIYDFLHKRVQERLWNLTKIGLHMNAEKFKEKLNDSIKDTVLNHESADHVESFDNNDFRKDIIDNIFEDLN